LKRQRCPHLCNLQSNQFSSRLQVDNGQRSTLESYISARHHKAKRPRYHTFAHGHLPSQRRWRSTLNLHILSEVENTLRICDDVCCTIFSLDVDFFMGLWRLKTSDRTGGTLAFFSFCAVRHRAADIETGLASLDGTGGDTMAREKTEFLRLGLLSGLFLPCEGSALVLVLLRWWIMSADVVWGPMLFCLRAVLGEFEERRDMAEHGSCRVCLVLHLVLVAWPAGWWFFFFLSWGGVVSLRPGGLLIPPWRRTSV
jgi:hypothetical protein